MAASSTERVRKYRALRRSIAPDWRYVGSGTRYRGGIVPKRRACQ